MAKKPPSQTEDIQRAIEIARKAVSKVSDQSLRPIAFQTILQHLLAHDEPAPLEKKRSPEVAEVYQEHRPKKSKRPRGPKGRIEELIQEGFFGEKRTLKDVKEGLAARTWFHRVEDLNPALLRLVKERRLRRIKEPKEKGGTLIWRYSKW